MTLTLNNQTNEWFGITRVQFMGGKSFCQLRQNSGLLEVISPKNHGEISKAETHQ